MKSQAEKWLEQTSAHIYRVRSEAYNEKQRALRKVKFGVLLTIEDGYLGDAEERFDPHSNELLEYLRYYEDRQHEYAGEINKLADEVIHV